MNNSSHQDILATEYMVSKKATALRRITTKGSISLINSADIFNVQDTLVF